ncbi:MAG: hypothetical protein L0J74_04075 [Corynebacterium sp.]|uniref:hypothetical protein n=1 Tax=Corynebacterium TaxID=1716 RepID=UPI0026475B72|nr:hypothetical protein [Corynebacterium sp.]MDN5722980.1 hypothetical protein [Corynebacterium sp.]MDN6281399.1 hypothetical protein [Corynebacterium sp.]MDN6304972.1 hypothetical protein [Corynebacterium sp.]MDN6352548.1 hypothetical protein [Corynebacterium sp.]MDN6367130.1 hypothetical protein [Corynebacterium sp.]
MAHLDIMKTHKRTYAATTTAKRRETCVGPWLPEVVPEDAIPADCDMLDPLADALNSGGLSRAARNPTTGLQIQQNPGKIIRRS